MKARSIFGSVFPISNVFEIGFYDDDTSEGVWFTYADRWFGKRLGYVHGDPVVRVHRAHKCYAEYCVSWRTLRFLIRNLDWARESK